MKIIYSPGGQLCNKIWSFTYYIARSFTQNEKIFLLNFGEYIHLFPNLSAYKSIRFVKNNRITLNICRLLKKITNNVMDGWQYRSKTEFTDDFFDKIHFLFRPHLSVIQKCEKIMSELKEKKKIVVGVHIRRGDYAQYMNGIYYFGNATYVHYMKQIQKEIGKEVCFFISSTEEITLNDPDLFCYQIPQATNMEDLYSLSLCNYILGPPSTFSMWASFYGKTPLRIVSRKDESISLNEFKLIIAVDTFQDGTIFSHNVSNPC